MAVSPAKYSFLVIPLLCSIVLSLSEPFWDHLEFRSYDARVRLCRFMDIGQKQPSGAVVMVAIEEHAALKKKPFIFWYPDLGRFLAVAAQSKARAVGIDMIPYHSLENKLAESFKGVEGALPEGMNLDEAGRQLDNALVSGLMQASRDTLIIQGVSGALVPFYYDLMAFMENVKPASLRVEADHDGILRSEIRDLDKDQDGFVSQLLLGTGAATVVPQRFRINFSFLDRIPVYPFEEVLDASFDRSKLKGKLIVLGIQSRHEDVHETPLGLYPGSLIHAAGLETLLTHTSPVTPGQAARFCIMLALCLMTFPLTRFRQPLQSFCWIAGMMFVYFSASTQAFAWGYDLPVFPHIFAPLVMFSACYLYRYMVEERSKRQLYKTFSYYVDPVVIDQLITQDPAKLMKGEQRDVCVMFLDIRGFTALSERISSEKLVSMLNVFFGRVSEAVQLNNGFVNKFIGDGMLAFFAIGERYVDDALEASRQICLATAQINDSGALAEYIGDTRLAIGIGLHCGSVVLGNIGSQRKLDFTVIGRPVNTASRIESLTKQYGRAVLVSEAVRNAAGERFAFTALGCAEIRGIAGGMNIFALDLQDEVVLPS